MIKQVLQDTGSGLVLFSAAGLLFLLTLVIAGRAGVRSGPPAELPPRVRLSPRAQEEINQLEARIDSIEAAALADLNGSPDHARRVALLGKLLLFDKDLSVN